MPVVLLPSVLRRRAGGQTRFDIPASTLRQALGGLEQLVPGICGELFDEQGELRHYVRIYINQSEVTDQEEWDEPLDPGAEIAVVAMMMGGGGAAAHP